MEFLDSLYFDYLQELSTERREELFSLLDNFFNEPEGKFSDLYNTRAYEQDEDEDISVAVSRAYGEQFAIDVDLYKFSFTDILGMITSAKYWLIFDFLKVQENITKKDLEKVLLETEKDAFVKLAKFYNAYPKKKPVPKQAGVIDFNHWRTKLTNDKPN